MILPTKCSLKKEAAICNCVKKRLKFYFFGVIRITIIFKIFHIFLTKKVVYRVCKPPSQSVYSGVCHRLALTSKIAIGFCSGVRHRLALMSKITIRLTMSRPLIYTIILTNMSYKRKRKTYFGFIHYRKHTLSSD